MFKKIFCICSFVVFFLSMSTQCFATSKTPASGSEDSNFVTSVYARKVSTTEKIYSTGEEPTIITISESAKYDIVFKWSSYAEISEEIEYQLIATLEDDNILTLHYDDKLGNAATRRFKFVPEDGVEILELSFAKGLASLFTNSSSIILPNYGDDSTNEFGFIGTRSALSTSTMNFVLRITTSNTDSEDLVVSDDANSSSQTDSTTDKTAAEQSKDSQTNDKATSAELVNLTSDDVVFEVLLGESYSNQKSIDLNDNETIIEVSKSDTFFLDTFCYSLINNFNPIDYSIRFENTDNGYIIHYKDDTGNEKQHTISFHSTSETTPGIKLEFDYFYNSCRFNDTSKRNGLTILESLLSQRGLSDSIQPKASKISLKIKVTLTKDATTSTTISNSINSTSKDDDNSETDKAITSTSSITKNDANATKKPGLSLFIPAWLIKTIAIIVVIVLIYLSGKKQLIEDYLLPKLKNLAKKIKNRA